MQRRGPRYQVNVPVRVITQALTKPTSTQGRGSELNVGGMAVSADTDLAIGAQILVEFTPPQSRQSIQVRCFVRNRVLHRYGVEFITECDSDYESVGQIETILRNLGSSPS